MSEHFLVFIFSPFCLISSQKNDFLVGFSLFEVGCFIISVAPILTALSLLIKTNHKYIFYFVFISMLLHLLINNLLNPTNFLIGILLAALIAAISNRLKFLTTSGSLATFLLASFLFGLGGLKWSVPILTFFILSSLISKVRKKHNHKIEEYFEKSGVRDHWQVLANGGIGGLLVIMYVYTQNELFYLLNIASLAAVCADTWATEIGTYNKANTYNIINLKKVEQGRSGGISVRGTLGTVLATIVMALSGLAWINFSTVNYFMLIIFAGVFGSLVDSIIGATIQLQYQCRRCNKVTEKRVHCGEETNYFKGVKFINNDFVNFCASISAIIFIVIFSI